MVIKHSYTLELSWKGSTDAPRNYDRSHTLKAEGKPEIAASADPSSLGDPKKWNPEEMLLGSLASCHMLWYLYLCSVSKIVVTSYRDLPTGSLEIDPEGKSRFTHAMLSPQVVITDSSRIEDAQALQQKAHEKCFIVNSVNFPVEVDTTVTAK